MAMKPEELYRQLGRLIETMPDLDAEPMPTDAYQWLGRADALVNQHDDITLMSQWSSQLSLLSSPLGTRSSKVAGIRQTLYRVLAAVELKSPAGVQGAFIPAGNSFDAFAAIAKVLKTATSDVFIVDPYLDHSVLTDFAVAIPDRVSLRLLADEKDNKATLTPAANKWVQQHGAKHPLALRLAPARAVHDRSIFIDRSKAWNLTQSMKDFAARAPGEIIRADETAMLKIPYYEEIWNDAKVVL